MKYPFMIRDDCLAFKGTISQEICNEYYHCKNDQKLYSRARFWDPFQESEVSYWYGTQCLSGKAMNLVFLTGPFPFFCYTVYSIRDKSFHFNTKRNLRIPEKVQALNVVKNIWYSIPNYIYCAICFLIMCHLHCHINKCQKSAMYN